MVDMACCALLVEKRPRPEMRVVDPAIFGGPVSCSEWKSAQNDAKATMVLTDASVFLRYASGWHRDDPGYVKILKTLAHYRLKLKLRSNSHCGPPPYWWCREVN
jgi:hypothetical protein